MIDSPTNLLNEELIDGLTALQRKLNDLQSASVRISYGLENVNMAVATWQQKKQDLKRHLQRRTAELQFFIKRQERLLSAVLDSRDTDRDFNAVVDRARSDLRNNLKAVVHESEVLKSVLDMASDAEVLSLGDMLLEGSGVSQTAVSMEVPELQFQVPTEMSVEDMMSKDFGCLVSGKLTREVFTPEDNQETFSLDVQQEEGREKREEQGDDEAFVTETYVIETPISMVMPSAATAASINVQSNVSAQASRDAYRPVTAQAAGNAVYHTTAQGFGHTAQTVTAQESNIANTAEKEAVEEEEVVVEEEIAMEEEVVHQAQEEEEIQEEESSDEEMIVEEVLEYVNGKMQVVSKVTRPAPKPAKKREDTKTKTTQDRTVTGGFHQTASERGRGTDVRRTANSSTVSSARQQPTPSSVTKQQTTQFSVARQQPTQPSATTRQQLTQSSVTRQQQSSVTTTSGQQPTQLSATQQSTQPSLTTNSGQQPTHPTAGRQETWKTDSQTFPVTRPTTLQRQAAVKTEPQTQSSRPAQLQSSTSSSLRTFQPGTAQTYRETRAPQDGSSRSSEGGATQSGPSSMTDTERKPGAQTSTDKTGTREKGPGTEESEHVSTLTKFQDFRESLRQRRRELLESSFFSGPATGGHPAVAHLLSRERRVQSLDRSAPPRDRRSSSPAVRSRILAAGAVPDPAAPPSLPNPQHQYLLSSSTRSSDSDDSVHGGGDGAVPGEGGESTPPMSPREKSSRPVRRAVSAASDRAVKMEFLRETWRKRKELLIQNEGYIKSDQGGGKEAGASGASEDASDEGATSSTRVRAKESVRSRVSSLTEALKKSGKAEEGTLSPRTSGRTHGGSPDPTAKPRPWLQASGSLPETETAAEAQVLRTVDLILQKKNVPIPEPQLSPGKISSPPQPPGVVTTSPTLSSSSSSSSTSSSSKPSMMVRPRPREPSPAATSTAYVTSAPLETLPEDEGKTGASPERKPGLRATSPTRGAAGGGGEAKDKLQQVRANMRRKRERWRSLSLT